MTPDELRISAQRIVNLASIAKLRIVTAESCTGGLVAAFITDIAGSSAVLDRGFVTYSNDAKVELLDVPLSTLEAQGAVSEPVARAMAEGALRKSRGQVSVAITGVAGPGGGSAEKPVGLVHFAAASGSHVTHREMRFGDVGREQVRLMSVATALTMIEGMILQS